MLHLCLMFIVIIFYFCGIFYSSLFGRIVKSTEVLVKSHAIWRLLTSPYVLLCSCGLVKWAYIHLFHPICSLLSSNADLYVFLSAVHIKAFLSSSCYPTCLRCSLRQRICLTSLCSNPHLDKSFPFFFFRTSKGVCKLDIYGTMHFLRFIFFSVGFIIKDNISIRLDCELFYRWRFIFHF